MYLFFDTETTGLHRSDLPPDHPEQGRIVQLAALLTDEARRVYGQLNIIVHQRHPIPEHVTCIHGISTELMRQTGVSPHLALEVFEQMLTRAEVLVAHNLAFDRRMLLNEAEASQWPGMPEVLENLTLFCTMESMRDIVCLPPTEKMRAAGRMHHKSPSLSECYRFLHHRDLEGAHDAMVDVNACADVFFWLMKEREDTQITEVA